MTAHSITSLARAARKHARTIPFDAAQRLVDALELTAPTSRDTTDTYRTRVPGRDDEYLLVVVDFAARRARIDTQRLPSVGRSFFSDDDIPEQPETRFMTCPHCGCVGRKGRACQTTNCPGPRGSRRIRIDQGLVISPECC